MAGQGEELDEAALHMAVDWILRADAILIACGGCDWGQQWEEPSANEGAASSPEKGSASDPMDLVSHIDPKWFAEDPALAWGYWLDCREAFREKKPNPGHEIVKGWAARAPLGSFCLSSGLTGLWSAAGWPLERLMEPEGWAAFLTCCKACGQEPWPEPEDLELGVDPETHRALGCLPSCPSCGSPARPSVRFSKQEELESPWAKWQQASFGHWCDQLFNILQGDATADGSSSGDQVVFLDLGCAKDSSACSLLSQVANNLTHCCKIVRLEQPQEARATRISKSTIVMPVAVSDALRRMHAIASALEPDMASFIVRDDTGHHGAEVATFADATMRHVFRRALASMHGSFELEGPLSFRVMHVHAQSHTRDLGARDIIPEAFFFTRLNGDSEEPPVTFVHVSGVHFQGRNDRLNVRVDRIARLLVDLIAEFSQPDYQRKLARVEDKVGLQKIIREVHLRVLKLHDFPVDGADQRFQQELVMQMQGFLHTGMVTPQSNEMGNQTLGLSGYARMPQLPMRKGPKPKGGEAEVQPLRVARPSWKRNCSRATCAVILRHGQREDYVALGEGRGREWVAQALRPWDPPLADAGRRQARAAAQRIREVLEEHGLPVPSRVFTSPYMRCVETAQAVVQEFGLQSSLVEEGLMEAVCEAWMRQWAVPEAEGRWGGPEHAMMSDEAMSNWETTVQGPPYSASWLKPEAVLGTSALTWTPQQLAAGAGGASGSMVNPKHKSCVSMRSRPYCWNNFERKEDMEQRVIDTIQARAAQNPGRTLIFVSHGGPTMHAYKTLTGNPIPKGSGGMAALSILRKPPSRSWHWDALVSNDASHSAAFHKGVQ